MLVTVSGAFVMSWCPFFVTLTLWKFQDHVQIYPRVFTGFVYLVYTLPAINPVIYAYWCRDIRKTVIKLLTCRK